MSDGTTKIITGYWPVTGSTKPTAGNHLKHLNQKHVDLLFCPKGVEKNLEITPKICFIELDELPSIPYVKNLIGNISEFDSVYLKIAREIPTAAFISLVKIWTSKILLLKRAQTLFPDCTKFIWIDCVHNKNLDIALKSNGRRVEINKYGHKPRNPFYNFLITKNLTEQQKAVRRKSAQDYETLGILLLAQTISVPSALVNQLYSSYVSVLEEIDSTHFIYDEEIIMSYLYRDFSELFQIFDRGNTKMEKKPAKSEDQVMEKKSLDYVETIFGSFYCYQNDLITRQLKRFSAHCRNELAMLRAFIAPGQNIIDIGAHIGTFSIPLSKFIGDTGRVFSFEANKESFDILSKNILENRREFSIFPKHAVISQVSGVLHEKFLPGGGNSGMFYFSESKKNEENAYESIRSLNIDEWHSHHASGFPIHLIKIDVEGAEMEVIQSCSHLIGFYYPILYIEINETALERTNSSSLEIERILKGFGYEFFKNIGQRNSINDNFNLKKLDSLQQGGEFFDLLAIHSRNQRLAKAIRLASDN